jgi:Flp pilus assembly pilin Flp
MWHLRHVQPIRMLTRRRICSDVPQGELGRMQLMPQGRSSMHMLEYANAWLAERLDRDEAGQTATEYVLVILGVVLFLVFAAFALNDILGGATNSIKNWVTSITTPPAP